MNDSNSDSFELGHESERSNLSENNESLSHQEKDLHNNSDFISLEAESDEERFDHTEDEN